MSPPVPVGADAPVPVFPPDELAPVPKAPVPSASASSSGVTIHPAKSQMVGMRTISEVLDSNDFILIRLFFAFVQATQP